VLPLASMRSMAAPRWLIIVIIRRSADRAPGRLHPTAQAARVSGDAPAAPAAVETGLWRQTLGQQQMITQRGNPTLLHGAQSSAPSAPNIAARLAPGQSRLKATVLLQCS
jgi:hypothetical protein